LKLLQLGTDGRRSRHQAGQRMCMCVKVLLDRVSILALVGSSEDDEEEFSLTLDGERIILGKRRV